MLEPNIVRSHECLPAFSQWVFVQFWCVHKGVMTHISVLALGQLVMASANDWGSSPQHISVFAFTFGLNTLHSHICQPNCLL